MNQRWLLLDVQNEFYAKILTSRNLCFYGVVFLANSFQALGLFQGKERMVFLLLQFAIGMLALLLNVPMRAGRRRNGFFVKNTTF